MLFALKGSGTSYGSEEDGKQAALAGIPAQGPLP